jgi:hypothetical protein
MPYDDPDPRDPHELVGVALPGDRESMREMAVTFAEEFAALGFDEERLLGLFRRPENLGAYRAYRVLGEVEVQGIIREALEIWGRFRVVVRDTEPVPRAATVPGLQDASCGGVDDRETDSVQLASCRPGTDD